MVDFILLIPVPDLSQPVRVWKWQNDRKGGLYKEQSRVRKNKSTQPYPKNIITEDILNG